MRDHNRHFSRVEVLKIVLRNFCVVSGQHLFSPRFSGSTRSFPPACPAGIEGSDDDALVTGEQDEELSRWEQEQIRKGINIPQVRTKKFKLKKLESKYQNLFCLFC